MVSTIRTSAPGKLMLLGEHAVLHGCHCLVCAIDRRITVTWTPRRDAMVTITADLGRYEGCLPELPDDERFRFVLAALRGHSDILPSGCDLVIDSDFPNVSGLGSSAAVTVAAVAAAFVWSDFPWSADILHAASLAVIREVQGAGAGADAAASTFGGLLEYCADPISQRQIKDIPPIEVLYSGRKAHTAEVVAELESRRREDPHQIDAIFHAMNKDCGLAVNAGAAGDWQKFGEIINRNHEFMTDLGLSDTILDSLVHDLQADPGISGAKLSGAGKGDCIVGIGHIENAEFAHERLGLQITKRGVEVA